MTEEEFIRISLQTLQDYRDEQFDKLRLLPFNDPLCKRIKEKIAECDRKITELETADVVPMRSIEDLPINRGFSIGH